MKSHKMCRGSSFVWRRRVAGTVVVGCILAPGSVLTIGADVEPSRSPRGSRGAEPARYTLIGIGDSLTHGTMDGANNSINTLHAYLQRVADSLQQVVPLTFSQPLFDESQERISPFRVPTNVSVDGADLFSIEGIEYFKRVGAKENFIQESYLCDALLPRRLDSKSDKVMYPLNVIARGPVSQVDAAIKLTHRYAPAGGSDRAIVVLWAGNNDSSTAALGSGGENPTFIPVPFDEIEPEVNLSLRLLANVAKQLGILSTDAYTPTSIERHLTELLDFEAQYAHVLDRLQTESSFGSGNVELFLLTLPYYSAVGYLIDSEDLEYYLRKLDPTYTVPPTFARLAEPGQPITDALRGDRISLLTFGFMYSLLHTGYSAEYVNTILEKDGVQRDDMVLSDAEQTYIRGRIDGFNGVIRALGRSLGQHVHVVGIGEVLNAALTGQIVIEVGGRPFTRKWVRGGAFSLDGVHPGYVGQAFIANYILGELNAALGIKALPIDLEAVFLEDPYIDHDGDGFSPGPDYVASGLTEILFFLKDADDSDPAVQTALPVDLWDKLSDAMLEEVLGVSSIRRLAVDLGLETPH